MLSSKNRIIHNHTPARHREYLSPLEKLDRRTAKWKPNKVEENKEYARLCRTGEATPFQPSPSSFRYLLVNRLTPIDILNELIELVEQTSEYTIDTECQSRPPPRHSEPALLQIELVRPNSPSVVILLEALQLPPADTLSYRKIKTLCRSIFSKGNTINSWGDVEHELSSFYRLDLFERHNIRSVRTQNIQAEFKIEFHRRHPASPYVTQKRNESYSLQTAIFAAFNEWLDKRMTLADWGCGLAVELGAQPSSDGNGSQADEEEIRRLMVTYAINDCLAVTKLVKAIRTWRSLAPPHTVEETERNAIDDGDNEFAIDLHPPRDDLHTFDGPNDSPTVTDDEAIRRAFEPVTETSSRRLAHVSYEPCEDRGSCTSPDPTIPMGATAYEGADRQHRSTRHRSDKRSDFTDEKSWERILKEVMQMKNRRKVHVSDEPRQQQHPPTSSKPTLPMDITMRDDVDEQHRTGKGQHRRRTRWGPERTVHVSDEPKTVSGESRIRLERNGFDSTNPTLQQLKNRRANQRRRARRYRYEVIRRLYPAFNVTRVKRILRAMDIRYVNINIVRNTLFIGLKSQSMVDETEKLLHSRIFTESHYRRL